MRPSMRSPVDVQVVVTVRVGTGDESDREMTAAQARRAAKDFVDTFCDGSSISGSIAVPFHTAMNSARVIGVVENEF